MYIDAIIVFKQVRMFVENSSKQFFTFFWLIYSDFSTSDNVWYVPSLLFSTIFLIKFMDRYLRSYVNSSFVKILMKNFKQASFKTSRNTSLSKISILRKQFKEYIQDILKFTVKWKRKKMKHSPIAFLSLSFHFFKTHNSGSSHRKRVCNQCLKHLDVGNKNMS